MKTKDALMFVILSLIWGSSFMWIKIALEEVGPFMLVALRLLFGVLGLVLVLLWRRPQIPRSRSVWLKLVVVGFFNTAFPFILISAGEQVVDSSVASILNGTVPLFTIVLAQLFLDDDRMTLPRVLGLLLGFLGVIVIMRREGRVEAELSGQLAILVAAISYAGSAVYTRRNLKGISPILQAFGPMLIAEVFVWGALPIFETPIRLPGEPLTWIALIWLGILGSCTAYLLYFSLLHSIGPTRTTLVTYVLPVIGVFLGVVFLNEVLDGRLIVGASLVLFGVVVVNLRPKRVAQVQGD